MKPILLDGSQENGNTGELVREALTAQLQTQGRDVEHIVLREKKIGNCGEAHHHKRYQKHPGALAICETFARQARFEWADSLALGGGQSAPPGSWFYGSAAVMMGRQETDSTSRMRQGSRLNTSCLAAQAIDK